jgi:undecaprenyl pyrophosphate synthase
MTVILALSYSGRDEIVRMAKELAIQAFEPAKSLPEHR